MHNVGMMFKEGIGTDKDLKKALFYLNKSIELGFDVQECNSKLLEDIKEIKEILLKHKEKFK